MGKCSTLIYSINNLEEPSEQVIDFEQCFNEIDANLQMAFKGIELEVNTNLVKRTLALIKGNQILKK